MTMLRKPRLKDIFVFDKPKCRPRPFVTQDGTTITRGEAMPRSCIGEPLPIWGGPIALDQRPALSGAPVTFDGAVPSSGD